MDETKTSEREQSRHDRRSVLQAAGVAVVSGALFTGSATAQLSDEVPNSTTETYEESFEQAAAAEDVADEYDFESPAQPENPADDFSDDGATEYDSEEVSQTVTNESVQMSNESVEISDVTSDDETAVTEEVSTEPADTSSSVSDELAAFSELEFDFW
ncbi:hypothetical protein HALLA_08230 [Halostagnicola larsenii XH-48]|uniref:Uncharacterized protein n=1 Tax=Halostagnicola larsenii XH-48 TaxID=797299 RepID=W0JUV1_9EURY|nr:hypothetical protein [Halostagnicola larsenii]AHG00798.1 hypothetical protein HALLA_08230 [Halostagnicola larsenii XH-48]